MSKLPLKPGDLPTTSEHRFVRALGERFQLRLHISVIIAAAWCCGVVTTWQLHGHGMNSLTLRYAAALLVSYAAFLAGVRWWLWYLFGARSQTKSDGGDFGGGSGSSGRGGGSSPVKGGGGSSAGGGAGGHWEGNAEGGPRLGVAPTHGAVQPGLLQAGHGEPAGSGAAAHAAASVDRSSSGGDSSSSGGKSSGSSGGGEGGGALAPLASIGIGLVFVALALAVFASVGYVVYVGPELLGDAAFNFLLSGGLAERTRKPHETWIERVARATWRPFAVILGVTLAFAVFADIAYPKATTMFEVLRAAGWLP